MAAVAIIRRRPRPTAPSSITAPQPYRAYVLGQPDRGAPRVTAETFMSLPPFYASMRLISGSMASLPVLDPSGDPIDVMPDTGTHLLANPTAHDTFYSFIDSIMMNLMIEGNAFVVPVAVDRDGAVSSLEVIHPEYVLPRWNRAGTAASFEVGAYIDGLEYGPSDFIHLKEVTAGGYSWGISKLKLLARTIGVHLSEQAHVKNTYDDGALPTGYFAMNRPIDSAAAKDHEERIAQALGGRGNAVTVLPEGMTYESITLKHADLQLLQSRQWSAAEAAMVMGVPPHLIGTATYDSETYSNARMDMAAFEALTLNRYKAIISQGFAQHGISFRFGSADLAQPSMLERVQTAAQAVQAGLCSPAQAAERLGWPEPDTERPDPMAALVERITSEEEQNMKVLP